MQSSNLKTAVCMQAWSRSNLSSRCGTARIPHKHNCLLGTMISNEMRLQHHCNLSGKINAAECALLPRVSASSENGGVSLALFFFPHFFFPPGSLNAFFFFLWRTRCVFAHKLSGLYSFTRICCEYLMVDGASVQGLSMPTKRRCKIAAISFHFLPRCGFCCCLFVYFFLVENIQM